MRNIIKYTIGLPILVIITVGLIIGVIILAVFEIPANICIRIITGNGWLRPEIAINMLDELVEIWQPI